MGTYPRVLIVNQQSLNKNNATGITLRSLWADWPLDNVLEIFTDNYEIHVSDGLAIESVCIPTNTVNKLAHGKTAKKINSEIKQVSIDSQQSIKTTIRQAAVLALDMVPITIPKTMEKRIREFQPEIIYTLGATVSTLKLVYEISTLFDIPIVIHYMDNWPEHLQWENNPLIVPYRKALDRQHRRCLTRCKRGLAISPQMAEAYSDKFNIPFSSIMNSINVTEFYLGKKKPGSPLKFVYAGGLHLNRWKALLDISKVIKEDKIEAELHIYTGAENSELYRSSFPDNTFFHKPVDHSQIRDVYEDADVLVHAEVQNPLLQGFFRYSISTKIPEYLASGRIVLFYGPKELGLYQYLKSNEAAFTASNYGELREIMKNINTSNSYDTILGNAYTLANENHNSSKARGVLKNTVISCLERTW